jgi:hypothetical protein
MLKIGTKRRRTKAQVEADREEARIQEESMKIHEEHKNVMEE